jgi:hypothetical protein
MHAPCEALAGAVDEEKTGVSDANHARASQPPRDLSAEDAMIFERRSRVRLKTLAKLASCALTYSNEDWCERRLVCTCQLQRLYARVFG